ncbi:Heavy metal-associated isoprenylated plant protein 37, partial [Mucuna pruriens]
MSTSDAELLKIETFVLKVHMNCQGCMNKVRKVLQKVEGVCKVDINAEEQKAIVTGIVNPSTLVQKLAKFGKHAEIWNAGYNDGQNDNQVQLIFDPSASQNQYMIPTFDEDHWGSKWCFNQDMDFKIMESEMDHHFAAPLFLDYVNNKNKQNFTIINENPKWEENMIPMMRPACFHENSESNYSSSENQEWAPSPVANIHGYYHEFHPSNMM